MVLTKLLRYYWDATQHPQQHFLGYEQNQQVNVEQSFSLVTDWKTVPWVTLYFS